MKKPKSKEEMIQLINESTDDDLIIRNLIYSGFLNNTEVMLQAFKKNFWSMRYAGKAIRNDLTFMSTLVEINGNALQFGSEFVRSNSEIVLKAAKNRVEALHFASEELLADKEFILKALELHAHLALYLASNDVKSDPEVALKAVILDKTAINFVPEKVIEENKVYFDAIMNLENENGNK